MSLGTEQERFSLMVAKLITYAYTLGYKIRLGEGYNAAGTGHMKGSTRYVKLAIDINLFKDGVYLTDGADHSILHDYWDSLGGAERIAKDLNHYSIAWQGVR